MKTEEVIETAEEVAERSKTWRRECSGDLMTTERALFLMVEELADALRDLASELQRRNERVMT
jgi:hypothetical protein